MPFSIKHLLLLPALLGSISVARAQAPNCAALKTENEALKDKIVAYEARLGIGVGGVRIEDGDPFLKVKFISCKASKSTHQAVLTYQILNSGEPLEVELRGIGNADYPSQVVDEQGQTYPGGESSTYPTVGGKYLHSIVPSNVPFNGTLTFINVPTTTTRLNTVVLSFVKSIYTKPVYFKTTMHNMPITWGL